MIDLGPIVLFLFFDICDLNVLIDLCDPYCMPCGTWDTNYGPQIIIAHAEDEIAFIGLDALCGNG